MQEIEVKILEIDEEDVIEKLEKMGAKRVFEGDVETSYFDFDNRTLLLNSKVLRLRKIGEKTELTFKQRISNEEAKVMNELEVEVDDLESMRKILEELGLTEFRLARKHRITYVLGEIHFELDTFEELPTFLEIEAPSVGEIKKFVGKLGFTMKDARSWSGMDVLRYYGKV